MRTWGRITNPISGLLTWVEVDQVDYIWVTTLIQNLKLNLGESPFYSQNGIPAQRSVIQQLFPDFYVTQIQQQFAKHFASLTITKRPIDDPTYDILAVLLNGTQIQQTIAI